MRARLAILVATLLLLAVPARSQVPFARTVTLHTAAGTETGTVANSTGLSIGSIQITGTFGGATVTFKASTDGTNFTNIAAFPFGGGGGQTSTTSAGQFWIPINGAKKLEAPISGGGMSTSLTVTLNMVAAAAGPATVAGFPALGQGASAASVPVVLPSDPVRSSPLPTVNAPVRTAPASYRLAIANVTTSNTAPDMVQVPATSGGTDTSADGGSLTSGTTYHFAVSGGNVYGVSGFVKPDASTNALTLATAADANNAHSETFTVTATTGATYYDIGFSTDANPKWVARITAAQLAAGGAEVTAFNTVDLLGGNAAGTIKLKAVGTGLAFSASTAPFNANSAYRPDTTAVITTTGYSQVTLYFVLTPSYGGGVSLGGASCAAFTKETVTNIWQTVSSAVGNFQNGAPTPSAPLTSQAALTIDGNPVTVCVQSLSAGCTLDIYYDLK